MSVWFWLCGCFYATTGKDGAESAMLDAHNTARADHGVGAMAWDDTVAAAAADWAQHLADQGCPLEHSGGEYGENLYWTSATATAEAAVASWMEEEQFYDYDANTCADGEVCGHYTQVVWADSVRLGCASASCGVGGEVWVCEYDPPGNFVGERPY